MVGTKPPMLQIIFVFSHRFFFGLFEFKTKSFKDFASDKKFLTIMVFRYNIIKVFLIS